MRVATIVANASGRVVVGGEGCPLDSNEIHKKRVKSGKIEIFRTNALVLDLQPLPKLLSCAYVSTYLRMRRNIEKICAKSA